MTQAKVIQALVAPPEFEALERSLYCYLIVPLTPTGQGLTAIAMAIMASSESTCSPSAAFLAAACSWVVYSEAEIAAARRDSSAHTAAHSQRQLSMYAGMRQVCSFNNGPG